MSDQQDPQQLIEFICGLVEDGLITKDQVVELTSADVLPPGVGPMDLVIDIDENENLTIRTTPEILEHIRALLNEGGA